MPSGRMWARWVLVELAVPVVAGAAVGLAWSWWRHR